MSENRCQYRGRGSNWRGRRGAGFNRYGGATGRGNNRTSSQSQRQSQPKTQRNGVPNSCPYKKWTKYMKDNVFIPGCELVETINKLYCYFKANLTQFNKEDIEEKQEVTIDFQALVGDPDIIREIPSLLTDIKNNPSTFLPAIGMTLHEVFLADRFTEGHNSIPTFFDATYINVRLMNYGPMTALKNLKANYFGKFVAIRGTVVRVGSVKPFVTKMGFTCNTCGEEQVINFPDGIYIVPSKCNNYECRGRVFTPQRMSSHTETIDWQTIKIQEIMLDDQREAGRIPRTVECELTYGLVNSCAPGDVVTVNGIVKVTTTENDNGKSKDKSMYLLHIHAVSVLNSKDILMKEESGEVGSSEFTMKELYAIREIQSEDKLFRLIVGSLCPAIYGHELVKAGLVLALIGGSQNHTQEKNNLSLRSNPHVLVVGDPGLGKSQMLQAVANVAPRGVYVCGNTTTTSGLTVTLSREGNSGDYLLEAGALVLSDRGCCCIDEFDKMGNQHQALLEAMEQQSISIAKAGLVCSLPARTSIIAAANPVGGHYNKGKTVSENLKLNSALLSRFDLVFILLDKPDEEMDGLLSEHVMSLHSDQSSTNISNISVTVERDSQSNVIQLTGAMQQWNDDKPLSERLKITKNESFSPVPVQLLRKYIQYARKYVNPRLSSDAANVLQEFYLDLRRNHKGSNCTPITTRQLESLIRLTEARARLELREKASGQDAKDVVEIMRNSLVDIFSDEIGNLDFTRSHNGSGMSKRAQSKRFISELNNISERDGNSLFNMEQMYRIATQLKLPTGNFEDFITNLNNQNFLLKKGPKLYQLQTSSCL